MKAAVGSAPGREGWRPVWILLAGLATAGLVRLAMAWRLPLPFCVLRKFTGLPCPACGSTRSLLAWTHLDPVAAFQFNPLFCLGSVLAGGWLLLWVTDRWTGRARAAQLERAARKLPLVWILAILAALNWVYLCFSLPK
ncbi:MAG TPA: DUF2752 domain-containing protein [Verrucomicrobiae bacterium]|nr:DUF2752 domain-containing protein [Verrucomicrobiae bacterium]